MQKISNQRIAIILIFLLTVLFIPVVSFADTDEDVETVTYSIDSNATVDFDEDDFNDVCTNLLDDELDYVKFTLPDSSYGTLYYNYTDEDDYSSIVKSTKKYYFDGSPHLSYVTFVPDEDFSGTVTIKYTGYDIEDDSYSGKIKIVVSDEDETATANLITYNMDSSDTLDFDEDDFNDVCDDLFDEDLNFVKFTLPSTAYGILYYQYTDEDDYSSKVTSSKKYYYDDSPNLSDITFVPDDDYSGSFTIKYTGCDTDGNDFSGKIKISVSADDTVDTILYSIDSDEAADFDEDDFNDICNDLYDEDLDYITFTLPSSSCGTLYYDYGDDDSYKVSSSKKYYYDDSPYLSKISFVPKGSNSGVFTINYTAYDTEDDSYSGVIEITVSGSTLTVDDISYSCIKNASLYLKDADFNDICQQLTGSQLSYVEFTLPSSSYGILYYGYNSDGSYTSKVDASTKYYYTDTPFLLNVAFVPAEDVTGTESISYTGYDTNGFRFSGEINITIGEEESSSAADSAGASDGISQYFSDIDESYSWAAAYVDKLYESGIVTGTIEQDNSRNFNPAYNITRGDFMLILYRAFNLQSATATDGFSDVPSDSYYYDAITTAKSLNIAQGSDNCFYPDATITREDAMVLVQRALAASGKSVTATDTGSLASFYDSGQISDYAQDAVAALVNSGIITGCDNLIRPNDNLTRAEVASIVYKIK